MTPGNNPFFDLSLNLLCTVDTEGRLLQVNSEWTAALGYTPENLTGQLIHNFIHPEDRDKVHQAMEDLKAGKPLLNAEMRLRTHQGDYRRIEWRARLHEEIIYAAGWDITEKKIQEEQSRILSAAIEQAVETVLITDTDGRIIYVNPAFEKITGYNSNEVLGENPRILKSGNQPDEYYKEMWETITAGQVWEGEFVNKSKEGRLFYEDVRISPVLDENKEVVRFIAVKHDITERRKAQKELQKSQELLNLFFKQSLEGVFFMMMDTPLPWPRERGEETRALKQQLIRETFTAQRITQINQSMLDQYGAREEDFLGLTPRDFFAHNLEEGYRIWEKFFDDGKLHVDTKEKRFDGSDMEVEGNYICLYDEEGRITGHFGVQRDVTRQRELERQLREAAIRDALTGLYNRRHLFDRLREVRDLHLRENRPFALSILDIDHFKKVNDTWGHQSGDIILKELASLLKEASRGYDIVGRYGGEEFIILAPDTSGEEMTHLMERILEKLRPLSFTIPGGEISITFSAGVASSEEMPASYTVEEAVEPADRRLYQAKEAGRNRVIGPVV